MEAQFLMAANRTPPLAPIWNISSPSWDQDQQRLAQYSRWKVISGSAQGCTMRCLCSEWALATLARTTPTPLLKRELKRSRRNHVCRAGRCSWRETGLGSERDIAEVRWVLCAERARPPFLNWSEICLRDLLVLTLAACMSHLLQSKSDSNSPLFIFTNYFSIIFQSKYFSSGKW